MFLVKIMEEKSDERLVMNLKQCLADYFSALNEAFPKMMSLEKEAIFVIDKLQDHLEQAAICQR